MVYIHDTQKEFHDKDEDLLRKGYPGGENPFARTNPAAALALPDLMRKTEENLMKIPANKAKQFDNRLTRLELQMNNIEKLLGELVGELKPSDEARAVDLPPRDSEKGKVHRPAIFLPKGHK